MPRIVLVTREPGDSMVHIVTICVPGKNTLISILLQNKPNTEYRNASKQKKHRIIGLKNTEVSNAPGISLVQFHAQSREISEFTSGGSGVHLGLEHLHG